MIQPPRLYLRLTIVQIDNDYDDILNRIQCIYNIP